MTEAIGIPVKEAETRTQYPNLRFEPGDHGSLSQEEAVYSRYNRGDMSAHFWNPGLVDRIKATKPKIIAVDGLTFGFTNSPNGEEAPSLVPTSSDFCWVDLPATPQEINPAERSILVVNGDSQDIGDPFNYPLNKYPQMQGLRSFLENAFKGDASIDTYRENYAVFWTAGIIEAAIGGYIAKKVIDKQRGKQVSRRAFLKGAADATTEAGKNMWLDVVDWTDPEVLTYAYEQMRTALFTLKTKDSIDHVGLPRDVSSSVIAGDGHSPRARSFIADDAPAQEAIKNYIRTISPVLTAALSRYPSVPRELTVERIKAYLAQTFVLKVDQPDTEAIKRKGLQNAVSDATSTVADFKSKRVKAALKDFH